MRFSHIDALEPGAVERALAALGWEGRVRHARTFRERLQGMIGTAPLDGCGSPVIMVFPACRSVHTFYMRYPLDIAFIDAEGSVLARCDAVGPRRLLRCPHAVAVLERAAMVSTGRSPFLSELVRGH